MLLRVLLHAREAAGQGTPLTLRGVFGRLSSAALLQQLPSLSAWLLPPLFFLLRGTVNPSGPFFLPTLRIHALLLLPLLFLSLLLRTDAAAP